MRMLSKREETDRQLWALKVFSSNGLGWLNSGSFVGLQRTGNGSWSSILLGRLFLC